MTLNFGSGKKERKVKNNNDKKQKKTLYQKPEIQTEKLTAVAVVCNGTTVGNRKVATTDMPPCASNQLKS